MNWTAINEAFPSKDYSVLVAGWSTGTPETDRVFAAARLLDAWGTEDADGQCAEVRADDAQFNELTFTWQPIQPVAAMEKRLGERLRRQGIVV